MLRIERNGADMLEHAEHLRHEIAAMTPRAHKSAMGQFMTPLPTARFMAGLFEPLLGNVRILDAGAGLGALTCATLDRWLKESPSGAAEVVAHELDDRLREHLEEALSGYRATGRITTAVRGADFIARGVVDAVQGRDPFTHAILNPPYKKISNDSKYRLALRRLGLETVNLYSGFVGVALSLLVPGGQLVAIIPRSFCNGPYYRPFRDFLFERAALQHIHLFEARDRAFKEDDVLQENVIVLLERNAPQKNVIVSVSTDDTFSDVQRFERRFDQIVQPRDPERFIHIAGTDEVDRLVISPTLAHRLGDLDLDISTGPVVDFRVREHLTKAVETNTAPLLYPLHLDDEGVIWPKADIKKWNGIRINDDTRRWLMPNDGWYVVTRRFSSKEERRRVVPTVIDPSRMAGHASVGFENHLNVFHRGKHGLAEDMARGLSVYLGSTLVDAHFRRFNGHTQVNATDLRSLPYPSLDSLKALGVWAKEAGLLTQQIIDARMEELIA